MALSGHVARGADGRCLVVSYTIYVVPEPTQRCFPERTSFDVGGQWIKPWHLGV